MDLDSSPQAPPPASESDVAAHQQPAPTQPAGARTGHPLLWAAVLVWLSVEAIGDGLLALATLLQDLTVNSTSSQASTASKDQTETPASTPSW